MERQLKLLEVDEPSWRIDDETRAIGRAGVADARRALAEALHRTGRDGAERTAA
jgi:hypothetical protein